MGNQLAMTYCQILSLFAYFVFSYANSVSLDPLASSKININDGRLLKYPGECSECHNKDYKKLLSGGNYMGKGFPDIDILASYSDASGKFKTRRVKLKNLSPSWSFKNPGDQDENHSDFLTTSDVSVERSLIIADTNTDGVNASNVGDDAYFNPVLTPVKIKRKIMREKRVALRTATLLNLDIRGHPETPIKINNKGKFSIWRQDFENPQSDKVIKLMRDQVIMARAFANLAMSNNESNLYISLMTHISKSQKAIGEAKTDAELEPSSLDQAQAMGRVLATAKDRLFECSSMVRKLRAMLQSAEDSVSSVKSTSANLIQLAAKTVPRTLHCLHLQLAADYYFYNGHLEDNVDNKKLEDPSLYHYAIFSDNVLATSVVVNSTVVHVEDSEKHVFHVVTDKLNFAAMKMWFAKNRPKNATVQVQNIDEFKWLNASYCSVLRQLESARIKEYYFKANHPTSITAGADNLKYRNPKYLSMLNHLRFYLPEVYPKLDKILFLDDDIVVQKDLSGLWKIDMGGMVNGAVETCKESFHRFDKYLNFSNPKIYENFDRNACGWAFGMNMFDLKEWKVRNITGIYHRWQDANEDRTLWKLGTLPPGLLTFYNLTYPLERKWHALGLGYDPALNETELDSAAVVHYNGNYKPWLDLAIAKYKPYWDKYVPIHLPYLHFCGFSLS